MNDDSSQSNGIPQQPSPTTSSTYQSIVPDVEFEQPTNDNLDAKDRENQPLLGRMDHTPGYNHFPGNAINATHISYYTYIRSK